MQPNFFEHLEALLKTNKAYVAEDGRLLRNKVAEAAATLDPELLRLLLSDAEAKKRFFADVDGTAVFDKTAFGWVVENRAFLPDSFTRFKNRIGLADARGEFLASSGDVVLSFPYKDCVLEGGQTKEDQKRSEVFYNRTLAPDEIDRLLDPKALCHAVRHDKDGAHPATSFDPAADNLVLKGNNLLALASLLPRYEGRVKLIYIDPPYYFASTKTEDTFAYNSSFKLSTWLVFMRNRLELAWKLLADDGALFVQINDDGEAELMCLLKEVFNSVNENNFVNRIAIKTKSPSGFASVNPGVFETAEYVLLFAKHKKQWKYHPIFIAADYDENYKWVVRDTSVSESMWIIDDIGDVVAKERGYDSKKSAIKAMGKPSFRLAIGTYALANKEKVFRFTEIGDNAGGEVVRVRNESKTSPDRIFKVVRPDQYDVLIQNGRELTFYTKKVRSIDGELMPSIQLSNIWTDTPYEGISKEGSVTLKKGKKPETLLRRIIDLATVPGDIVFDYHLGSGTTCAVAHKMGRRYIGIEQLDYGENDSIVRLNNVIRGDKSGISKAVGWKGGGSFVSCELAKCNAVFAEEIAKAADDAALTALLWKILDTGYASHRVWTADVKEYGPEFAALPTEEKRKVLFDLLDANMLYVNRSDAADAESGLSDADKAFTRSFYGE